MARRSPPRKVTYFEPVPPRLARNTIIESTFEVGRRFRCTMRVDCGQLNPGVVIRPVPGEWHPRIPERSDNARAQTFEHRAPDPAWRTGARRRINDTSVAMIERNYSAFISDLTDGLTRAAVFDVTAPAPYVAAATRAESFR